MSKYAGMLAEDKKKEGFMPNYDDREGMVTMLEVGTNRFMGAMSGMPNDPPWVYGQYLQLSDFAGMERWYGIPDLSYDQPHSAAYWNWDTTEWDYDYISVDPPPDAYETFKCPVETFRLNTVDNGIVAISGVNEFYTCDFTISAEQGTIENGDVWYLTLQGRGTYPALLVSGATIEIAGVTFADSLVFTASGDQLVQPLIAYSTEGTNTITIPSGLLSLGTATVILNAVHIPLTGKPSWYVKEA